MRTVAPRASADCSLLNSLRGGRGQPRAQHDPTTLHQRPPHRGHRWPVTAQWTRPHSVGDPHRPGGVQSGTASSGTCPYTAIHALPTRDGEVCPLLDCCRGGSGIHSESDIHTKPDYRRRPRGDAAHFPVVVVACSCAAGVRPHPRGSLRRRGRPKGSSRAGMRAAPYHGTGVAQRHEGLS